MKACLLVIVFLVMYSNGCCKETDNEGYKHNESNLTTEDNTLFGMRPLQFTAGTLLGLLVASLVVVIGSFLVLWRLCCDVEMRVSREVMEPLKSISQRVSGSPRPDGRSVSGQALLGHSCSSSSSVEIA